MSAVLKVRDIIIRIVSIILLLVSLAMVVYLSWIIFGNWYLHLDHPIGGDYYTGLTYATYFAKYLPFPPSGWLNFWNSGVPLIGGYQWLTFYIFLPLTRFFDTMTSLDYFSVTAIIFFFMSCHLLYFQLSKNHMVALSLSLIGLTSQSVYFQLTASGLITGSSMQFYLPLSLFFLLRFLEYPRRIRLLLLAALVNGLAILHHPAMSILFVAIPSIIIFLVHIFMQPTHLKKWLGLFFTFVLFTTGIGSMALFPYLLQMSFNEIASKCDNPQCWGIYPYHIERWLGWLPVIVFISTVILTAALKAVNIYLNKKISWKTLTPIYCGLLIITIYPVAAYFHLIDNLANSIFPRRMLWALLVMLLAATAANFRFYTRFNRWVGWGSSLAFMVTIFMVLPMKISSFNDIRIEPQLPSEVPNSVPNNIYKMVLPKFKDAGTAQMYLKDIASLQKTNTRIDIHSAAVTQWWNLTSAVPVTRGYTSGFNRDNIIWTYYLQDALKTDQPGKITDTIVLNRAKFLFDAFGVGYTAYTDYHPVVAASEKLYEQNGNIFKTLRSDVSSTIVSATNSDPILFVGDDEGYHTFIALLSNLNLNSRFFIPVKGPQNVSDLKASELNHFTTLFLYRFDGNLNILEKYIKNGGKVFIEFGSLKKIPKNNDNYFSSFSLSQTESDSWEATIDKNAQELSQVDVNTFAPLLYKTDPWKLITFSREKLPQGSEILLSQRAEPLIIKDTYGSGLVYMSGMNLPFHIVEYANEAESLLFNNIMQNLFVHYDQPQPPQITKHDPGNIEINLNEAKNIFFKENYHPGWKAKINGTQLPVYNAGTNFIYIPISNNNGNILKITFEGTVFTWGLWYLTLCTLLLLFIVVLLPRYSIHIFSKVMQPFLHLVQTHTRKLESDEHDKY